MKVFKKFGITFFVEDEIFSGAIFGIYFYTFAIEFNIRFLWFDIFIFIGKIK